MISNRKVDLRQRLRDETGPLHHALDERVSAFDISTPGGLGEFLTLQHLALTVLEPVSVDATCAPLLRGMLRHAEADLRTLGRHAPCPPPVLDRAPHPLALDYLIAGSRLGTMILRKRWAASDHPEVRAADAYFSAPAETDYWTAFCRSATEIDADGARSDQVVDDAVALFGFYVECADAVSRQRTKIDA